MELAPIPYDEHLRLNDLLSYNILDSKEEPEFNELLDLAAHICGCPTASITFIDKDRQWYKSRKNIPYPEGARDISICGHAILQNDVFVIEDTSGDNRFVDNPDVMSGLNVGFYAAAPIVSAGGFNIGAVCVMDHKPKKLTEEQKLALQQISAQITKLLDLRHQNLKLHNEINNTRTENKNNYRSFFNDGLFPRWIYDIKTFKILEVNQAAIMHYGYSREEFLTMTVWDIRSANSKTNPLKNAELILESKNPVTISSTHLKKSGEEINVEVTASTFFYKGEMVRVATINDITDQVLLMEKLKNEEAVTDRKVNQATILAIESEKDNIGKELHDNINQILATTKLFLDLATNNEDMRMELIIKSKGLVTNAIEEIRKLSKSLVSPALNNNYLSEAIENLITDYTATTAFKIHFTTVGNENAVLDDIKLTLFRIVQEQLNNISKYAKASNVWLKLRYDENIELSIKDDGQGFDVTKKVTGIGLNNIITRVKNHNGKVDIVSMPGNGCTVIIILPLISSINQQLN